MLDRKLLSLTLLVSSFAAAALAQAPPDAPDHPAESPAGNAAAAAKERAEASPAPTQSQASSSPPAASAGPAGSPAPAELSADTLKKAHMAGFREEKHNGKTMFCQESANVGTRFATKKCMDPDQLQSVLDIHDQTHDSLRKATSLDPAMH